MTKEEMLQRSNELMHYANAMIEARKQDEQQVVQAIAQVRKAMMSEHKYNSNQQEGQNNAQV